MTAAPNPTPAKLGDQIAGRLEALIRDEGWPSGHYLGNEEALARRFGASRTAVREAIAITEWLGLVERRRGREGGLYVCAVTDDPAVALLRNFLFLDGATLTQLLRSRQIVEGLILDRVAERIGADEAEGLARLFTAGADEDPRAHLNRLKGAVDRMSALAGAPLLQLFGGALRHCFVDRTRTTTLTDTAYLAASHAVEQHRRALVEAICTFDRPRMLAEQTRAMDTWRDFARTVPRQRLTGAEMVDRLTLTGADALIYEFVRPAKRAEAVARAIAQTIADKGLGEGARLGTELELTREYGVSRRMFREGIRILERFGVVRQGRGKSGGLRVGRPHREVLLETLRGLTADRYSHDDSAGPLLRLLLLEAVRAIVADPAARAGFLADGRAPMSAAELAGRVAGHCPDRVIGTLIAITLACGADLPSAPVPATPLAAFLAAVEAVDTFAAPRRLDALWTASQSLLPPTF